MPDPWTFIAGVLGGVALAWGLGVAVIALWDGLIEAPARRRGR